MVQVECKFKPTLGATFGKKRAAIYGTRLSELVEKNGFITPGIVVEDARNARSPLHDFFDWDNTVAAEKWRIVQARSLIMHVSITVVSENKPTIRQFFSVTPTKEMNTDEIKVYIPIGDVMNNEKQREEVIKYAKRELEGWTLRYAQYSELFGVIKAIKRFKFF